VPSQLQLLLLAQELRSSSSSSSYFSALQGRVLRYHVLRELQTRRQWPAFTMHVACTAHFCMLHSTNARNLPYSCAYTLHTTWSCLSSLCMLLHWCIATPLFVPPPTITLCCQH
jgi:hypothetical protein